MSCSSSSPAVETLLLGHASLALSSLDETAQYLIAARNTHGSWQKQALLIVQPDTLLRWHRELFHLVWKRRSKAASHTPKIAAETIALIREMAVKNRLWGAERIRGELLKLGMHVCKRTIQKYVSRVSRHQAFLRI